MPKLVRFKANFSSAVERYRELFIFHLFDCAKLSVCDSVLRKRRAELEAISLSGYWKYSDSVVRFHIKPVNRRRVALAFMPRNAQSMTEPEESAPPIIEQPAEPQLTLPIIEITQPTHSNDLEHGEIATSQELTPEVNAGPSFNF